MFEFVFGLMSIITVMVGFYYLYQAMKIEV